MKTYKIYILLFLLFSACDSYYQNLMDNDPRLVKPQNAKIEIDTMQLDVKYLKLLENKNDKYPFAQVFTKPEVLKSLTSFFINKKFNFELISLGLFTELDTTKVDLKEWRVVAEDVDAIDYYFIRNDSIIYTYHNLKNNTFKSYTKISNASCDAYAPFMFRDKEAKNKAYVTLLLEKRYLDRLHKKYTIKYSKKEDDDLDRLIMDYWEDK